MKRSLAARLLLNEKAAPELPTLTENIRGNEPGNGSWEPRCAAIRLLFIGASKRSAGSPFGLALFPGNRLRADHRNDGLRHRNCCGNCRTGDEAIKAASVERRAAMQALRLGVAPDQTRPGNGLQRDGDAAQRSGCVVAHHDAKLGGLRHQGDDPVSRAVRTEG